MDKWNWVERESRRPYDGAREFTVMPHNSGDEQKKEELAQNRGKDHSPLFDRPTGRKIQVK